MEDMLHLVEIQKVICNKKNSVLFIDTECVVLSSDFKLPNENHVLLRDPRENNMYNVDLKNVVPSGDLTCLFAKETLDESNLWPRRLGHINFKAMNKLVKGNLVRGLPSKVFENNHTCVACKKGKQHRASCKSKPVSSISQPLQRVLVTKPHNNTPYELLLGRKPSIGFMRPFGCPVTILNTLDPLEKFDGKADEGFLVGYSVNSKAFRVFNSRTRISMNYQPVVAGNQPNSSAGIQENFDAGKVGKESVSTQQYVLLPLWSTGSKDPQNTDAVAAFDDKENESEVHISPSSSDKPKKHDEKAKREDKGKSPIDLFIRVRDLSDEFKEFFVNSTNRVNAVSTPVIIVGPNSTNNTNCFNAAGTFDNAVSPNFEIGGKSLFVDLSQYPNDPDMPALEDIIYSDDEEDVSAEANFSNLETSISVSPIPTTRVHKDHHVTQIIGDLSLAPQTRSMTRMVKEQGGLAQINDEDFYTCIFACFLSQEEPKRVHQTLKDPSWIEAMQEELLQFKMQKVWVQIVDFLTAHLIQYALMFNPTIYVSCIKQFWASVSIKKSNDVMKLQALIDRKKCMSAKRTAWNEFSSSTASAVIRLATVMINAQLDDLCSHNTKYTFPVLTRKVFANMRRIGKGFLGVETPLFDVMLVQQQVQDDAEVQEDEDDNEKVANLEQDKIAQALEITKLNQMVRRLEKKRRTKHSSLNRLKKDTNEEEPAEVEEVLEVVTADKLMTEVVTTIAPIATAVQVPKPSSPRKRRGVVIQDSEETAAASVIMHIENDVLKQVKRREKQDSTVMKYHALKRKPLTEARTRKNMLIYLKNMAGFKMNFFKGMTYGEIRPIFEKHYNSIKAFLEKEEEEVTEQEEGSKRKGNSLKKKATKKQRIDKEAEELKRHLQIIVNDDDDVYTEATPLASKVPVVDYQIHRENNKPYYKIIRADGTHKLFLSFITLLKNFDRKDLKTLWKLVKERFKDTEPKKFSDDFLLNTFKIMFEKPNVKANVWRDQKGGYGLAKKMIMLLKRSRNYSKSVEVKGPTGVVASDMHGCSYKTFRNCQPHSFNGTEGVVRLTHWFEKLEQVFEITKCTEDDKPASLHDVINMARELIEQAIQAKATKIDVSNKRKLKYHQRDNNFRNNNTYHRQQNRRQDAAKAYAVAPARGKVYLRNIPLCNRYKLHHHDQCSVNCKKCKRIGHQTKDYWSKTSAADTPPTADANA
nr:putative ribonuclease H-like domain-containing protein [Tanacetum cinerariifolium]